MKKDYMKYLNYIMPFFIFIVLYFGYSAITNSFKTDFAVYKPGIINDCANRKEEVNKALLFSDLVEKEDLILVEANQDNIKLYETSSCVNKEIVAFKYLVLDDFNIEHIEGVNSQIYQPSYLKMLEKIKDLDKDGAVDKQVINSLEYYLNDAYAKQFINENENYQINSELIGPKAKDPSGTYVLVVKVNLVKANVYQDKDQTKLKDSEYFFDSLGLSYEKVGVDNEENN